MVAVINRWSSYTGSVTLMILNPSGSEIGSHKQVVFRAGLTVAFKRSLIKSVACDSRNR